MIRDYVLFWTGSTISFLGTRATAIAYPLLALAVLHSPVAAGLIASVGMIPYVVLYLPGGVYVDRRDARTLMIAAETARLATASAMVAVVLTGKPGFALFALVAFADGTAAVIYSLAEVNLLRGIVDQPRIAGALAGNEARTSVAGLLGRPVGGLLFGLGHAVPFAAGAVTSLVSIGTLASLRPVPPGPRTDKALLTEVAEGLRWLLRDRFLRATTTLSGLENVVAHALFLVYLAVMQDRGVTAAATTVAFAATGAGGLAGAACAQWFFRRYGYRLFSLSLWVWALAMIPLVFWLTPATFAISSFTMTFAGIVGNVACGTYMFTEVPPGMLARVKSVDMLLETAGVALGPLAGGLLIASLTPSAAVAVLLAGTLLIAAASLPTLRPGGR
ncbi:MFS transporter [Herbidospora sp. NBRC 101105]|uniref:MFS transporter n=1 Tax=Herbidospora sp. NBRC 101105 TaxID=3032195 RepID=UPI0024A2A3AF|nr:MFS transporter [Herbidospora sp. NBRC 101105]GLX97958.1 MFS transporter [Herbidospora sp. NBRC 101105]